ncbi:helix-turn-helix domain-containing protein [Skermania piniformis]|uniref:Helix-turn-helix domain-containing protein n=1 Tax=Skermania pinensis TaxID=39122 RepID=A0ABX8SEM2_9ACTN|nr:helix-turn-helix transcriptional regulator [Skermania piniformis]QXQ14880.1 helix-turn-helix domain-containing protein [Skermania piniformis]
MNTQAVDAPTYAEQVAGNIRAEVARAKLAQTTIADALGLTQTAVSRRLRGATEWALSDLPRIAELLGTTVADLVTVTPPDA